MFRSSGLQGFRRSWVPVFRPSGAPVHGWYIYICSCSAMLVECVQVCWRSGVPRHCPCMLVSCTQPSWLKVFWCSGFPGFRSPSTAAMGKYRHVSRQGSRWVAQIHCNKVTLLHCYSRGLTQSWQLPSVFADSWGFLQCLLPLEAEADRCGLSEAWHCECDATQCTCCIFPGPSFSW